jgi:hypothetical protein
MVVKSRWAKRDPNLQAEAKKPDAKQAFGTSDGRGILDSGNREG